MFTVLLCSLVSCKKQEKEYTLTVDRTAITDVAANNPGVEGGPTSAAHTALHPTQLAGAVPSGDIPWGWTSGLSPDTSGKSMTKPAKNESPHKSDLFL